MKEEDDIFKPIPFFEWCKNSKNIKPITVIENISGIISKVDDAEIWEHLEFIKNDTSELSPIFDIRDYLLTMIGRFAANEDVTTFEMNQVHSVILNLTNVLRFHDVLTSEWLEEFDEQHQGIVAASSALMMRIEDKKYDACLNNNGPEDLNPSVAYQWINDETGESGVEMFSIESDDSGEDVYERLTGYLQFLKTTFGPPVIISIIGDSYIRETYIDDPEILKKAETIKEDFHTLAETDVREALTVISAERDTDPQVVCCLHSVYRYDDSGLPVFDGDNRSIQILERDQIARDPSHRGKMGTILCDFFLENKGL